MTIPVESCKPVDNYHIALIETFAQYWKLEITLLIKYAYIYIYI